LIFLIDPLKSHTQLRLAVFPRFMTEDLRQHSKFSCIKLECVSLDKQDFFSIMESGGMKWSKVENGW